MNKYFFKATIRVSLPPLNYVEAILHSWLVFGFCGGVFLVSNKIKFQKTEASGKLGEELQEIRKYSHISSIILFTCSSKKAVNFSVREGDLPEMEVIVSLTYGLDFLIWVCELQKLNSF